MTPSILTLKYKVYQKTSSYRPPCMHAIVVYVRAAVLNAGQSGTMAMAEASTASPRPRHMSQADTNNKNNNKTAVFPTDAEAFACIIYYAKLKTKIVFKL